MQNIILLRVTLIIDWSDERRQRADLGRNPERHNSNRDSIYTGIGSNVYIPIKADLLSEGRIGYDA